MSLKHFHVSSTETFLNRHLNIEQDHRVTLRLESSLKKSREWQAVKVGTNGNMLDINHAQILYKSVNFESIGSVLLVLSKDIELKLVYTWLQTSILTK